MPDYTIRDPQTGRTVTLRGDSPPTEQELEEIFASMGPATPPQMPAGAIDPSMPAASSIHDQPPAPPPTREQVMDWGRDTSRLLATGPAGPGVVVQGVKAVPGVIARGLGISRARGGANMEAALEAGRDLRVPLNQGAQDAALRARDLVGSRNGELNQLFDRLTNPRVTQYRGDNLTAREAQDFVSKFGTMSVDDSAKLPAMAQREIRALTNELRAALTGTLDTVGKGDQYMRGVREYSRANRAAKVGKAAGAAAATAGTGYLGLGWLRRVLESAND